MKKSVILLIAVIYVSAFTLISQFGVVRRTHREEIIPVSEVTVTNDDVKVNSKGKKYVTLYADVDGERKFQIEYKILPADATDTDVLFYIDPSEHQYGTVDENGLVTITAPNKSITVYVVSSADTGKYDTIIITFRT